MPGRLPGSRPKAGRNTSKKRALRYNAAQHFGEGRLLGVAAHAAHRAGTPADGQGTDEGAAGAQYTPASCAAWAGRGAGEWRNLRAAAWGGRTALRQRGPGRYPASGTANTTAKPAACGT